MTYIIGSPCLDVKDQSCISVCPVDCIHPYERMLVIDPETCIDCGACEVECPLEAISPEADAPPEWAAFVRITHTFPRDPDAIDALIAEQVGVSR